jgi:hypothetical protein
MRAASCSALVQHAFAGVATSEAVSKTAAILAVNFLISTPLQQPWKGDNAGACLPKFQPV